MLADTDTAVTLPARKCWRRRMEDAHKGLQSTEALLNASESKDSEALVQ